MKECYKRMKMANSWKVIAIIILCTLALIPAFMLENDKVIDVSRLGLIRGSTTKSAWTKREIYQFLGVPFAESPSGVLRFKPPVQRSKWTGVLDATKYGRRCPVKGLYFPNLNDDIEDCLNLCIYTASFFEKRPVMVYVHGGGFYNGSAALFKPDYLLEKDIVLVVPQYRLGILGFLSTNSPEIPGNMAALDIISALEWIQKHISYFGGDPNRVTLFGQSAGAALVTTLMISPAVQQGLFHGTIVQSGPVLANWASTPYSIDTASLMCMKAGCTNCGDVGEINRCLIKLNTIKLLEIGTGDNLKTVDIHGIIIGDYNKILPRRPNELMINSTKYPMIAGVTKHDGSFLLAAVYDALKETVGDFKQMDPRTFIQTVVRASGEVDTASTIANMATRFLFNLNDIKKRDYKKMIPGLVDLASIVTMKSPTLTFAMQNSKNNPNPTYLYTFDYEGEHTYFGYGSNTDHYPFNGGAHHSNDYIYLFATHALNKKDTEVAKIMVDLWTSFAARGKPKCKGLEMWKPINESGPYLHINLPVSIGAEFSDEFVATINDETESIIRKDKEF